MLFKLKSTSNIIEKAMKTNLGYKKTSCCFSVGSGGEKKKNMLSDPGPTTPFILCNAFEMRLTSQGICRQMLKEFSRHHEQQM